MTNRKLAVLDSKVDVFKTPTGVSSWALELKESIYQGGLIEPNNEYYFYNFYSTLTLLSKSSLLIGIIETLEDGTWTFETLGHVLIHPLSIEHSSMLLNRDLHHDLDLLTSSNLKDSDKYNLYLEKINMVSTEVLMEKGISQKNLDRLPADIFQHITHFRLSYADSYRPGVLFSRDFPYADKFRSYTKQVGSKLDPLYTNTPIIKIEG